MSKMENLRGKFKNWSEMISSWSQTLSKAEKSKTRQSTEAQKKSKLMDKIELTDETSSSFGALRKDNSYQSGELTCTVKNRHVFSPDEAKLLKSPKFDLPRVSFSAMDDEIGSFLAENTSNKQEKGPIDSKDEPTIGKKNVLLTLKMSRRL